MNKHIAMGVINITPNSFSDGGKCLDTEFSKTLIDKFLNLSQLEGIPLCLDIGAESTAPFNSSVTIDEEWERIEKYFLPLLDKVSFPEEAIISLDTYKAEIVERFILNTQNQSFKIIWNDISGKLDSSVFDLLKKYPELDYVYCHNLCPSRELSSSHMDYVNIDLTSNDLSTYFKKALDIIKDADISINRIIFDPCFGFSKTLEQNYELLSNCNDYVECHDRWVLGVSKKSFLQALVKSESKEHRKQESESFHQTILSQWMKVFPNKNIFYRVHDPLVFSNAKKSQIFI
ncbi:MAG: hypothetical protein BM556_11735 [Bacteriovorax sp. MedPE-SWde]|nr:MAG: hypothetical protein BM556_11735 [Bacteriovorax sp. MedPE-SWde]